MSLRISAVVVVVDVACPHAAHLVTMAGMVGE
jgi:hypothetical protein